MKFSIHSDYFKRILALANEIVEKSSINTAYSYIAIQCNENQIEIKSADRHKTFYYVITHTKENKLSIEKEGKALFSGEKILAIFQTLSGEVEIEVDKTKAQIIPIAETRENEHQMYIRAYSDYPEVHNTFPETFVTIDKKIMEQSLSNTSFASSSDLREGTIFLTGVLLHIKDQKINAVATDRNRMSLSEFTVSEQSREVLQALEPKEIIIPSKFIGFIKRVFNAESEEQCDCAVDHEKLYIRLGNCQISVNQISGKYYDYARIIPTTEGRNYVTLNRETLKETLIKLASVFKKGREQSIQFTCEETSLLVSAEEKEEGKSQYRIPEELKGNSGQFTVKALFIIDPLHVMKSEKVIIGFGNNKKDLITIESVPAHDTLHIAAPQNV